MATMGKVNRQSRAKIHQITAAARAMAANHHSTGVPVAEMTRKQVSPTALQPCWPGLMPLTASTPSGRWITSHPDGFEA